MDNPLNRVTGPGVAYVPNLQYGYKIKSKNPPLPAQSSSVSNPWTGYQLGSYPYYRTKTPSKLIDYGIPGAFALSELPMKLKMQSLARKQSKRLRNISLDRIGKDIPTITAETGEQFQEQGIPGGTLHQRTLAHRLRPYEQRQAELAAERRYERKTKRYDVLNILFG